MGRFSTFAFKPKLLVFHLKVPHPSFINLLISQLNSRPTRANLFHHFGQRRLRGAYLLRFLLPALGVPGMLRVAAFLNQWLHGSLVWSIISLGHHLLTVDKVSHGCPPLANF
jgi:hypothetical protein